MLRWGVLSTAKIARQKVIPAMQRADGCQVVALAGRDVARAQEVAAELSIDRAHASYEALLGDPDVDAVYIPLPNHLHAEWTIRAAGAGKHVLCEKPMALSSIDARSMVDACAEAGVVFMEAFMYRLHPSWRAVLDIVRSGRIGVPVAVQSWFSYFNDDPQNIRNIAEYGGGALLDIGCYCIDLSRLLLGGEPIAVTGSVSRDPVTGVDTLTSGVLEFGSGTATFTCSTRVEPDQRVHIYGSTGRIAIDIPFNIPPDRTTCVHVTAGGSPPVAPATETLTFEPADQYRVQAEEFAASVRNRTPVPIPPEEGIASWQPPAEARPVSRRGPARGSGRPRRRSAWCETHQAT
jgi:predicted dehydrogenase